MLGDILIATCILYIAYFITLDNVTVKVGEIV